MSFLTNCTFKRQSRIKFLLPSAKANLEVTKDVQTKEKMECDKADYFVDFTQLQILDLTEGYTFVEYLVSGMSIGTHYCLYEATIHQ